MAAASMKRAGKVSDMEARDADGAVFERLPHDLQNVTREFWEFVQKEDTVVGQ